MTTPHVSFEVLATRLYWESASAVSYLNICKSHNYLLWVHAGTHHLKSMFHLQRK